MAKLNVKYFHPVTMQSLNVTKSFTDFSYTRCLSGSGEAFVCVNCKESSVVPERFYSNLEMGIKKCVFVSIECVDDAGGTGEVFTGYIIKKNTRNNQVCFIAGDCAFRIHKRIIREKFTFPNNSSPNVIINTIYNHIDGNASLNPISIGNLQAPNPMPNQAGSGDIEYEPGTTFFEILQDLAEKSGGEFRICNCQIDFAVPDENNIYGVGSLQSFNFRYTHGSDSNNIEEIDIEENAQEFCNVKLSRSKDDPKEYCIVPETPSDTIEDCGVWECFEDNPEYHDFSSEDECKPLPKLVVNASCLARCGIKIGDRVNTIIYTCTGEEYKFLSVILKINVRCENGFTRVEFVTGEQNHTRGLYLTEMDYIQDLYDRQRRQELT